METMTTYGVGPDQPAYAQLREQNRVLREALKAWMVYYEGHSTADNRDRAYFMTRAALTATSQPYNQATLSCGHHSGKVGNHCLLCGEKDATSQEGQG